MDISAVSEPIWSNKDDFVIEIVCSFKFDTQFFCVAPSATELNYPFKPVFNLHVA